MNFLPKKFDLNSMKNNPRIFIIGGQKSGKTIMIDCLAKFLIEKKNKTDVTIISGKDTRENFYSRNYPGTIIKNKLSGKYLSNYLERAYDLAEKRRNNQMNNQMNDQIPETDSKLLLIMDEAVDTNVKKMWNKKLGMVDIFVHHYSLQFPLILAEQQCRGIPPDSRENFDYIFLFPLENSVVGIKNLWYSFANSFLSFSEFSDLFEKCAINYSCLVINNTIPGSHDVKKRIFWFKASPCVDDDETSETDFDNGSSCSVCTSEINHCWYHSPNSYTDSEGNTEIINDKISDHIYEYESEYESESESESDSDISCMSDCIFNNNRNNEANKSAKKEYKKPKRNFFPYKKLDKDSCLNTEDLFNYFKNDKCIEKFGTDSPKKSEKKNSENKEPVHTNPVNLGENFLKIEYFDDNHEVSLMIHDLHNRKLIKTICNHILMAKKLKQELKQELIQIK